MFFYLSFLRPLPNTASSTDTTVSIKPQIANDLRTVYMESPVDIFYAWVPCRSLSNPSSSSTLGIPGSLRKLTTWRTSAMYKNLTIPLPGGAKAGEEWRLLLSCEQGRSNSNTAAIDLGAPLNAFGKLPLPAMSMPVRIESRKQGSEKAGKQENIERMYSIPGPVSRNSNPMLCIREQTSFDLDKKIWDSGLGLSAWLTRLMLASGESENVLIQRVKHSLSPLSSHSGGDGLRIVELGTGTGIVSICLSTLLENINSRTNIEVYATDLLVASATELIKHNISSNKFAYPSIDINPLVLDWDAESLPLQVSSKIDVILMADVTYNTSSFPSLVRTITSLIRSSKATPSTSLPVSTNLSAPLPTSKQESIRPLSAPIPLIILAYKQRDPAERDLWKMLRAVGVELEKVDQVQGEGEGPVEIWVGI